MASLSAVNVDALKSDIRRAIINQKANACPMVCRLAWHGAGTFDASDGSGGLDGARPRCISMRRKCPHT